MRIDKDYRNNRRLGGVYVVLVLVIVCGLALAAVLGLNKQEQITHSPSATTSSKTPILDVDTNSAAKQGEAKTPLRQTDSLSNVDSSARTPASIRVHAESQGDSVVIKTNLGAASDGECVLAVSDGAKSLTRSAPIIFTPEFSSCAGFVIGKRELSGSDWQIRLTITYDNKTITQSINYKL